MERVAGTGGGLGGPNASSVGKDVGVGEAVGIGRGGAGRRGIVLAISVEVRTARVTWQGR